MSTEIETEMTERAALNECPFCGDVAHILSFPEAPSEYVAECVGCGVGSPIIVAIMDDPIPAIEQAWNKRAYRMNGAARDVLDERKRQIEREGWSLSHDDIHDAGELAGAAICYLAFDIDHWAKDQAIGSYWPRAFDKATWWKPKSHRQNLVRAAALILAEIERLDRRPAHKEPF